MTPPRPPEVVSPPEVPPTLPAADDRRWYERHWWKVLIAMMIGGGLTVMICCGGLVFMVFGALRSNAVVDMTVELLDQEPRVIEHTGHPISAGWFVMGNINWHNDEGDASFRIPVGGPRGQVEAIVEAERSQRQWRIVYLRVEIEKTGDSFVLIGADESKQIQ